MPLRLACHHRCWASLVKLLESILPLPNPSPISVLHRMVISEGELCPSAHSGSQSGHLGQLHLHSLGT